jgi:hypothetical protein
MTSILKKIIRNDAMKEDPTEIYNARSFLLTLTVSALSCGNSLLGTNS